MTDQPRFRVAEAPVRGNRLAWSYLATVVGLLGGALLWAALAPLAGTVCAGAEDAACQLGWTLGGGLLAAALGLGLAAVVLRLGWEWWAVPAALLLGSPAWVDLLPGWVPLLVGVLAPAAAALATWTGPRRPPWRPWLIGVAAALLAGLGAHSVLL